MDPKDEYYEEICMLGDRLLQAFDVRERAKILISIDQLATRIRTNTPTIEHLVSELSENSERDAIKGLRPRSISDMVPSSITIRMRTFGWRYCIADVCKLLGMQNPNTIHTDWIADQIRDWIIHHVTKRGFSADDILFTLRYKRDYGGFPYSVKGSDLRSVAYQRPIFITLRSDTQSWNDCMRKVCELVSLPIPHESRVWNETNIRDYVVSLIAQRCHGLSCGFNNDDVSFEVMNRRL